jgi:non-specific serine/threonine protein kinase
VENIDRFADGVWCVELASVRDSELVSQTVAEALGVREEAGRPLIKTLVDRWRDRKFLLVLDNCEHLIPAIVKLADELLKSCEHIRLIATSREALRVSGEAIMRVGSLAEADAFTLFVERSTAVESSFRMTDETAVVIGQICRRVEDLPLAIELAAGRARMMSPAEILSRLQESFGVLAGGSRSFEGRHETLSTAIDWSYWLLSDEEQRLLRFLSAFFGGFTLDSADAVFGKSRRPTLELLGQLVDKSLVTPVVMSDGTTRYVLLETVREYSHDRLRENEEHDEAHARHGVFFSGLVEASRGKLFGPDRKVWLRRLTDDIDNLRALFELHEVDPDATLATAAGLGDFWEARGDYTEGRSRLETALRSSSSAPPAIRVGALQAVGLIAWAQGDQSAAARHTGDSLALSREIGDTFEEAYCLQQLGQIALQTDDFDAARTYLKDALALAKNHRFEQIEALCEWRLGFVEFAGQSLERANSHYQRSIVMAARIGDGELVAASHGMLGNIALRQGLFDDARSHVRASLDFYRTEGSSRAIANLLEYLADISISEGGISRALTLAGAADGLRSRISMVSNSPLHRAFLRRIEPLRQGVEAEQAWLKGATMSRQDAIAYALDELEGAMAPPG